MLNNSGTDTQSCSNEIFTYLAIPIEAFRAATGNQINTSTYSQNVLVKSLPDYNMHVLDTSHVSKPFFNTEICPII